MTNLQKQSLIDRNNKIIETILNKIKQSCPDSVDLIGICGSFCNGDIYEKSDLDLLIISGNNNSSILNKCFILDEIGFDIYCSKWSNLENIAKYNDPYVSKLLDLDIVYTKDDCCLKKYKGLRERLKQNILNKEANYKKVGEYYLRALAEYQNLMQLNDLSMNYMILAKMINNIEHLIYMVNSSYLKLGVKRIPEEIRKMNKLPNNFMNLYTSIIHCQNSNELKNKSTLLIETVKDFSEKYCIPYKINDITKEKMVSIDKKEISSEDLNGTYEEIYSNWKNKIHHAVSINNTYLSFKTMSSCQEFYDEMYSEFNIQKINLMEMYNPSNLKGNAKAFDLALSKWKLLYDSFKKPITAYSNLDDFKKDYIKTSN